MDRRHERDFDRVFNFARSALFIQPLSDPTASTLDDEALGLDPDEPPDRVLTNSSSSLPAATNTSTQAAASDAYCKKVATPMSRQSSLLTEGLLTAANLKDVPRTQTTAISRTFSQLSAYSLTSNHGLTSDGGLSSPAHSGTPSPPLPLTRQTDLAANDVPKRTIKFAGEQAAEATSRPKPDVVNIEAEVRTRKTCISFACAQPRPAEAKENTSSATQGAAATAGSPKRICTIKFACPAKPSSSAAKPPVSSKRLPSPIHSNYVDMQVTPKPVDLLTTSVRRSRGSQSTIVGTESSGVIVNKVTSGQAVSPTEVRKLEKKKKTSSSIGIRPEDEDWMNEEPKTRKPITVSDTLRKENAIRKLAEEASQELDEDYDIDDIVDDDDDDEDLPATGSRYMAYDEDESDGGHETDDEEGFADSDDESDDDPNFQFWTTAQPPTIPIFEQPDLPKPQHHRTASESSLDCHLKHDSSSAAPKAFLKTNAGKRRKSPKGIKMRPGTPELPDSTDFVCGTLDEDRPLEDAYISCINQRKLEKRGIIPQDLDPSFPTSDPENLDEDEEDEVTEGNASTASDHHFLGGRFDESDASQGRNRNARPKKAPSPRRLHSPPPPRSRFRSPAPAPVQPQGNLPASRKLFGRSPLRANSPASTEAVSSPPTSPKLISFRTPHLAQRNTPKRTASLPHTPNPFFVLQERKMRARARKQTADPEMHSRGPVDIKQGLEARKLRRKEQYWRKHCRDHKDKSRRCAPGKGAERMRELGMEMATRNKAYGQALRQELQLMISV